MKVTRADGKVIDEKEFDKMAREYEEGSFKGKFGKATMGRPRIDEEVGVAVGFRLPYSKILTLDERAASKGETRSEFLRRLVEKELAKIN